MSIDHKQALEHIENNNWHAAHNLVQQYHDKLSCLIHAYLHRSEGDNGNATYWYQRAGVDFPNNTLDEEFESLIRMTK